MTEIRIGGRWRLRQINGYWQASRPAQVASMRYTVAIGNNLAECARNLGEYFTSRGRGEDLAALQAALRPHHPEIAAALERAREKT